MQHEFRHFESRADLLRNLVHLLCFVQLLGKSETIREIQRAHGEGGPIL